MRNHDTAVESLSAPTIIDDFWRTWIAENLMLGAAPESLENILTSYNVKREQAAAEVQAALASPYVKGARRLKNRLAKRDWVLNIQRKMNRMGPMEVARKERPTAQEFLDQHYRTGEPVIITGAMTDWPAMRNWSLESLKRDYGDAEVEVRFGRSADPDYEMNCQHYRHRMPFGDYIDLILSRSPTNDFYMDANNTVTNREVLGGLYRDIGTMDEYLTDEVSSGYFFLGPQGAITQLHHDLTNNFLAQLIGRKRVLIIPACEIVRVPNLVNTFTPLDGRSIEAPNLPGLDGIHVRSCIVEPGEVLFLPVGCWHWVESLDITMSMTFTNFKWDNNFSSTYPPEDQVGCL